MQFVADGPDIPLEILAAQEEGRLVLFCGAGISIPAGLPSFKGLVDSIYQDFVTTRTTTEQEEWNRENYDRVLNLLEDRFGGPQLRQKVRTILATPPNPILDTHRSILELATERAGQLRLVTTNFDLLFEAARPGVRATAAPLLPVPKPHKWNHLVYLHGRLGDDDPDGQHLVLTSGDFGIAYLIECWASRFVSELFNYCTVLFVGYQLSDPVMRYLIDAIAAERRVDQRIHRAYALAGCIPGAEAATHAEWSAKGITPILYDATRDHALLHQSLKAWAGIWSGGLLSKLNIVTSLATHDPRTLPQEAVSQLCWAVGDPSGAGSREFAKLGKQARLAWLEIFEKNGLLLGSPRPDADARVALVDAGRRTRRVPPLDSVRGWLAVWLSEHLPNPDFARWVVRAGGRLHPELMDLVRRKLQDLPAISTGLRKVWLALSGSIPLCSLPDAYDRFGFYRRTGQEAWSPILRTELLHALSPCIEVRQAWTSLARALGEDDPRESDVGVASVLSFDSELEAGQALPMMLEELRRRRDWTSMLSDLAFDLTGLLHRALDLYAALDAASEDHDPSYIDHPSIEPHEQNRDFHGWTSLIELVREAFEALRQTDVDRARSLVGMWRTVSYPLFRRLLLYAVRQGGLMVPPGVLEMVSGDPRRWVWSFEVQVEFFATLPWLWDHLDQAGKQSLLALLLKGPPREMFREDLAPLEWEELRDHSIWERLARLRRGGAVLEGEAGAWLMRIEAVHPAWRHTGERRADFPTWMETRWGLATDFSAEDLLGLSDDDLLRVLKEHRTNREGLLDSWRHAAELDRRRALRLLDRLLQEGYLDLAVWSYGLAAFREVGDDAELRETIVGLLERLPPQLLDESRIVRAVADAVRQLSENVRDALRPRLLAVWDAVLPLSFAVAGTGADERVTDAINHPTGVLAEALLLVLRSHHPERNAGIEEDVRVRLERLISSSEDSARLGRVIVASRLPLLHDLSPEWTEQIVIPLFDWRDPQEATGAWQGFLWSPWIRPSLWQHLKPHFLASFDHLDALGGSKSSLAGTFASIAIEGEAAISPLEAGECLRKLDDSGREAVAIWICQRLGGAEAQSGRLWRDRIQPWLERAWPKEPGLRGPGASTRLSWAATLAGDAFAEAAYCVSGLIGPSEHAGMILREVEGKELTTVAPEACLELINALTPDEPDYGFELGAFLEHVSAVRPDLTGDPRYRRLKDIAIRIGL